MHRKNRKSLNLIEATKPHHKRNSKSHSSLPKATKDQSQSSPRFFSPKSHKSPKRSNTNLIQQQTLQTVPTLPSTKPKGQTKRKPVVAKIVYHATKKATKEMTVRKKKESVKEPLLRTSVIGKSYHSPIKSKPTVKKHSLKSRARPNQDFLKSQVKKKPQEISKSKVNHKHSSSLNPKNSKIKRPTSPPEQSNTHIIRIQCWFRQRLV